MRIDVEKYLLMGPTSVRDQFFKRIQKMGVIEFISHRPFEREIPADVQTFIDALHVLRHMVPVKQIPKDDIHSASVLAQQVVEKNEELERLREMQRVIDKEIARIEPFGDFSLEEVRNLETQSGRLFQYFFAKHPDQVEAVQQGEVIHVGHAYGLDYFLAINPERKSFDGLVEMNIDKSLHELYEEAAHVGRSIDEFEVELGMLAHHKNFLKQGLIEALNRHNFEDSKERAELLLSDEVFAVEGWIPKNKIQEVEVLADELSVHCEPIQVEEEDRTPTYLENKRFARLGEDLINIYDTPSTTDRDPSLWVFVAFGIFFSMIVADAGYGLILLGISLYLLWKFGQKAGLLRRVLMLSTSLSIGCIVWGIMTTSFLGIDIAPDSKLRDVSLINWMVHKKAEYSITHKPDPVYTDWVKEYPKLKEATTPDQFLLGVTKMQDGHKKYVVYDTFSDNVMIELAIFIGTLHILISFLRYLDRNWSGAGWALFLIGGYLYFPSVLKAVSLIHYIFGVPFVEGAQIGFYIMCSGIGLAAVLAVIQHKLGGLGEVMHIIGVFADVMSYLRIYALSLAGAIMASTFDDIGMRLPIYIGPIIILAGHAVNFTLALMGGVIHGLRLNFIEWYHYSFEGGGKNFNPLKLVRID